MAMALPDKIKPWSISTTVRNPRRNAEFLRVLRDHFDGERWNSESQADYQVRLIQERLYGAHNSQFYAGLDQTMIDLMESGDDIGYADAKAILEKKGYAEPGLRGRTSFKPLQKLGFASIINSNISITKAGHAFLSDGYDDSDLFLRSFLKWQLPNPLDTRGFPKKYGYDLKPFVSVLHLIRTVNQLCREAGINPVGISQTEFGVFALTMIRWDAVEAAAQELLDFRIRHIDLEPWKRDQQLDDMRVDLKNDFNMKHTGDYADNAIRYFRVCGLLRLRGAGRYVDLEPVRRVEIDALLSEDDGKPFNYDSKDHYSSVLGDHTRPLLPWENHRELERIAVNLLDEIDSHAGEEHIARESLSGRSIADMKSLVEELRERRNHIVSQKAKSDLENPQHIQKTINQLRGLLRRGSGGMQKSLALEWHVTSGLIALNDAVEIRPNYPKGDDGKPRAHAPAGRPDIECYYDGFSSICEVTMSRNRQQWFGEGQPVMRHLRDFEDKHSDGALVFALFVAPQIHRDTVNTFWGAAKHEYEGRPQRIVPITIEQFCSILKICANQRIRGQPITKDNIRKLLSNITGLVDDENSSREWLKRIPAVICQWGESMVNDDEA